MCLYLQSFATCPNYYITSQKQYFSLRIPGWATCRVKPYFAGYHEALWSLDTKISYYPLALQ